MNRCQTRSEQN